MNVEIGADAVLFPEKEYISGIFVAVHSKSDNQKMPPKTKDLIITREIRNNLFGVYSATWYYLTK
jgi:hypothetical protein